MADDGVPQAVGFGLVVGGDLEGKGFVVLKMRAAVEPYARHTSHIERHDQHIVLLAIGVIARRAVHGAYRAVGKSLGVELRSIQRITPVPEAYGIFRGHRRSPVCTDDQPSGSRPARK